MIEVQTPQRFFVTGGTGGLGRALVLSAIGQGHDVAFTYLSDEAGAQALVEAAESAADGAGRCLALRADVTDAAQLESAAEQAIAAFESIDVAVANAAVNNNALAVSMTPAAWRKVIDVNLTGSFLTCQALLPEFLMRRSGCFVFVSSIAVGGASGQAAYAASKGGIEALSKSIAKEYGPRGVRSNVVQLGLFDAGLGASDASNVNREYWTDFCPLKRMGQPDDFASVVLFLASGGANFVNGATLPVEGGLPYVR